MKPAASAQSSARADAVAATAIATWPGDRPNLVRLMECHIFHRADWEYLGSRHDEGAGPWPIDAYRCGRCDRAWEKMT